MNPRFLAIVLPLLVLGCGGHRDGGIASTDRSIDLKIVGGGTRKTTMSSAGAAGHSLTIWSESVGGRPQTTAQVVVTSDAPGGKVVGQTLTMYLMDQADLTVGTTFQAGGGYSTVQYQEALDGTPDPGYLATDGTVTVTMRKENAITLSLKGVSLYENGVPVVTMSGNLTGTLSATPPVDL